MPRHAGLLSAPLRATVQAPIRRRMAGDGRELVPLVYHQNPNSVAKPAP